MSPLRPGARNPWTMRVLDHCPVAACRGSCLHVDKHFEADAVHAVASDTLTTRTTSCYSCRTLHVAPSQQHSHHERQRVARHVPSGRLLPPSFCWAQPPRDGHPGRHRRWQKADHIRGGDGSRGEEKPQSCCISMCSMISCRCCAFGAMRGVHVAVSRLAGDGPVLHATLHEALPPCMIHVLVALPLHACTTWCEFKCRSVLTLNATLHTQEPPHKDPLSCCPQELPCCYRHVPLSCGAAFSA